MSNGRVRVRIVAGAATACLLGAGLAASAVSSASAAPPAGVSQADFAAASTATGVPASVLLSVSYLASQWDSHAGGPSTAGGYGPMNLTDMSALRAAWGKTHADDSTGVTRAATRPGR
ncbi:hypothetical protein [Fodinicola feengrottensis]|uniref:hypothetical protein n=1 Tax=Fodinicola feengrottensis TaxID=435914 RepID=UPI00244186DD|nr:hypothetical protein [Fodinicola feengrottensis]